MCYKVMKWLIGQQKHLLWEPSFNPDYQHKLHIIYIQTCFLIDNAQSIGHFKFQQKSLNPQL